MIDIKTSEMEISLSDFAKKQIQLILDNDYTLEGLVFRLQISGKGCNGFDYSLGFTEKHADDLVYEVSGIQINIDPFSAYYCRSGEIDYLIDHENQVDGFLFTNHNEKIHRGKFFKDESTLPPMKTV